MNYWYKDTVVDADADADFVGVGVGDVASVADVDAVVEVADDRETSTSSSLVSHFVTFHHRESMNDATDIAMTVDGTYFFLHSKVDDGEDVSNDARVMVDVDVHYSLHHN